jgi:hypothetical protein
MLAGVDPILNIIKTGNRIIMRKWSNNPWALVKINNRLKSRWFEE